MAKYCILLHVKLAVLWNLVQFDETHQSGSLLHRFGVLLWARQEMVVGHISGQLLTAEHQRRCIDNI